MASAGKSGPLWPLIQKHAARLRRNGRRRLAGRSLALLLVVFGSLDVVTTQAAQAHGFLEGNPVMHFVQLQLGPWWAVPKVAAHILLASVILWLPTRKLLWAAAGMVLVYAAIVGHNLLLTGWLA
jgi:hypothetical protein